MMNKKVTKRALRTSVLCLLLCISMLIGTTYAWFTDAVTSGNNIIKSGNLDLKMYWSEDPESGIWHDVEDPDHNTVFSYDLWEPGYTQVRYIKLVNEGSLALNYSLSLTPESGVGKLAEVINVYFDPYGKKVESRDDLKKMGAIGLLHNVLNGGATADGTLLPAGEQSPFHPSGETVMALAMNMLTTAGNEYQNESCGDFSITALATQASYETDSFGADYDSAATFPLLRNGRQVSAPVNPVNGKVPEGGLKLEGDGLSVFVPAGTPVKEGAKKITVTVTPLEESDSGLTAVNNEVLIPVDIHAEGIDAGNTLPLIIDLGEILPKHLNMGNYRLFHVENGTNNEMTLVDDKANLTAHNRFTYDPLTGAVSVAMATFSEVAMVADTTPKWEGGFDYSWYTKRSVDADYTIANADQLAALSAIVGGMNGQTQDSFAGKTVKLLADINLNGGKVVDANDKITQLFYPIGYYNSEGTYERTNTAITSGLRNFEGTFDGNGHTISNFYHNTWEMKGDHDWYSPEEQYYRDGMGLFGRVYGGTVKNLTVDHFESDGEIATTGCIAAYADGATFENIAITNCKPRVYNIGNGGIAGCVGWYAKEEGLKTTFKNITVDNSNTISALWGSYDVPCGGIVGQYYPISGQTSAGTPKNAGIHFENCHVSAIMDVYNDVCANYQYYAYRYAGMLIGSVRENETKDGHVYPKMDGITAKGCTVHYETWNDYFYCELVANSKASYTHDHQFSRLTEVKAVDTEKMQYTNLKGETVAIPTPGRYNYVVVNGEFATENATCYHFVDGKVWNHADAGKETVGGKEIDVEDHAHIYLPFSQLFTGYGWGVTSKGISDYEGIDTMDITYRDNVALVEKFKKNEALTGDFLYRVGNGNAFPIGKLFQAISGVPADDAIVNSGVHVSVDSLVEGVTMNGTFVKNETDWTQSTLHITGGTGPAKLTIQDYNHCEPFELVVEVVDATNITSATAGTGKNFVLLKDVTYADSYLYYKNSTLYGNGFELDITGAAHSDLKDSSDTNSNKSAYCNIWMVNSRFDNVQIKGSVYPKVGMTADSDYGNAAIRTEGDCYITNSYISNCRVPLRVQGNTTLIDTVVDGGRYANIELRSGKLTLDGVTTINTVRKGSDGSTDVIGFGIVIHDEAANASIAVIGDGLKQYNWVGENKHKSILSGDSNLSSAYKLIFNANNSDKIYFNHNDDRYVNTGVLCLCADMSKDVVTGLDDRYCQEVSGYNAWVLTYDNSKHTAWFNESVSVETVNAKPAQHPVIPNYSGNEAQTVEFTKGETYYFDTAVFSAEKFGNTLTVASVEVGDKTYNYGDKIPFTEGGAYEVVYTVTDPYNYNAFGEAVATVAHTETIDVTAIAKDAEILAPKFTFIDQNGNKYESTTVEAGGKTYVMPNVTAADPTTNSMSSINIGSASISGTTVYFPVAKGYTVRNGSNFNRYYPLFNGINITDYTIAGDTTGTTYTTSGNYTSLIGSSGTKFMIPANSSQDSCGDYVKTSGQSGNAAGNSDSGWQGAGYSTSYGGTYLKSGNTNASYGADANGYERIVWVEYSFNAGDGDLYYYRIGYHCNKESAEGCFTEDTLITLADGSQKRVDQLTYNDQLLVWDFYKGEYAVTVPSSIYNHGNDTYKVTNLYFSDGTKVKMLKEHEFFNVEENSFVYISEDNVGDYAGRKFIKADGGDLKEVTLLGYGYTEETTGCYTVLTAVHYNCIAENMLSLTPDPSNKCETFFRIFEVGEGMKFDSEKMNAEIKKYGLFTYEDLSYFVTYEEFMAFGGSYFKVLIGKGLLTVEDIIEAVATYAP